MLKLKCETWQTLFLGSQMPPQTVVGLKGIRTRLPLTSSNSLVIHDLSRCTPSLSLSSLFRSLFLQLFNYAKRAPTANCRVQAKREKSLATMCIWSRMHAWWCSFCHTQAHFNVFLLYVVSKRAGENSCPTLISNATHKDDPSVFFFWPYPVVSSIPALGGREKKKN
jgi:hypothetical protein